MASPISKKWLPHTVTIFNVFTDPETGAVEYHRTLLEAVRVDTATTLPPPTSLRESLRGATKLHHMVILMDHRTTRGYTLNEAGRRVNKNYLPWQDWRLLPAEARGRAWTLNVGGLMAAEFGQIKNIAPEFNQSREQEFRVEHSLKTIVSIDPTIDKDGTVHSWEVGLD